MTDFLKRFWLLFGSIAVVLGLYLGAEQDKHTDYFYIAVPAAFALAAIPVCWKKVAILYRRNRDYPALLKQVAELEQGKREYDEQLTKLALLAKKQYGAGVIEGRAEAAGAVMSTFCKIPSLRALSFANGEVRIIAECSPDQIPDIGARYNLVTTAGDLRGVVEVDQRTEDPAQVFLICVRADSEIFWQRLTETAQYSSDMPGGLELQPTRIKLRARSSLLPGPKVEKED